MSISREDVAEEILRVATLPESERVKWHGHKVPGRHEESAQVIYWDGKTEEGEAVVNGTYFYQLQAGDYIETKKITIVQKEFYTTKLLSETRAKDNSCTG